MIDNTGKYPTHGGSHEDMPKKDSIFHIAFAWLAALATAIAAWLVD